MLGKGIIALLASSLLHSISALGHCDVQYGYETKLYNKLLPVYISYNKAPVNYAADWNPTTQNNNSRFYQSKAVICLPEKCGEGLQISSWIQFLAQTDSTDPQYGYADFGFNGFDGFMFSFWITNNKVWALYGRLPTTQTPLEYYSSAIYLIPIADRPPAQSDLYELWLDANSKMVSWRMNNYELLRIKPTGLAEIDSKFMAADFGGYFPYAGFPENGVVTMGLGIPNPQWYTGSPHTACMGTLFNDCLDKLSNAKSAQCVYEPLSPPEFYPNMAVVYQDLTVITRTMVDTCPQWTCELRNMHCEDVNPLVPVEPAPVCLPRVPELVEPPARLPWQKRQATSKAVKPRR